MKDQAALHTLLAPTVEALGYELWGCAMAASGRRSTLRIYIDNAQGITVDDCERVSRQISALLDVEDPIAGAYILEVSSPGLDRPLFTVDQFGRFIGQVVNIRLHVPMENRRNLKGVIQQVKDNTVVVVVEDKEFAVIASNIARANLVL